MLEDILLSEPPESKLLLALLSGSVICGGALFVCWLSGSSPTGVVILPSLCMEIQLCVFIHLGKIVLQLNLLSTRIDLIELCLFGGSQEERTSHWRAAKQQDWACWQACPWRP